MTHVLILKFDRPYEASWLRESGELVLEFANQESAVAAFNGIKSEVRPVTKIIQGTCEVISDAPASGGVD